MRALLLLLALATTPAAARATSWVDPHATARQAARLYDDGKFGDASAKYREALIDDPDSVLLHYNAAAAAYRDGKYDDAIAALRRIPLSDAEGRRTARVAYNLGNATYRLGAAAEASKPQDALARYAEALVAYRRAMDADPTDEDAKFNHELVAKKLADLKKKLEEQQKEQEQKDEQQKQDQQQGDEQKQQDQAQEQEHEQEQQQQQQEEQQQADGQQPEQPQDQAQQEPEQQQGASDEKKPEEQQAATGDEPQQDAGEQPPRQQPEGDVVAGEPTDKDLSRRDAEAILDAQRDQELRPDEMLRQMQDARVAVPGEDW